MARISPIGGLSSRPKIPYRGTAWSPAVCDGVPMGNNLRGLRQSRRWTIQQAADAMGMSRSGYQKLERAERQLTTATIDRATAVFSVTYNDVIGSQTVEIIGYVGAGFEAHFYERSAQSFVEVEAPPGASNRTVAVEVRGDSMRGTADEGSILYYDDEPDIVTPDMYGRLCIVWTADGRVLVKKPRPGSGDGLFHLESTNADTMFDVVISGASKVTWIKPR